MEGAEPSPPRVIRSAAHCRAVSRWEVRTFINSLRRGRPVPIIATGIDFAKNIFAVHGVNQGGSVVLRQPKVARAKLGAMIAGAAAWRDRDGSLFGRALLGTPVSRRMATPCG